MALYTALPKKEKKIYSVFSNLYIDPPEAGNISLSTCSPGVDVVSTTISEIPNIGSPTPNVTCSAPGVTVENGTIRISCDGHVNFLLNLCNHLVGGNAVFITILCLLLAMHHHPWEQYHTHTMLQVVRVGTVYLCINSHQWFHTKYLFQSLSLSYLICRLIYIGCLFAYYEKDLCVRAVCSYSLVRATFHRIGLFASLALLCWYKFI